MANKPLYGANGKPIYGVGGKPVYGVDLYYSLKVEITHNSYSYFVPYLFDPPLYGSYAWGNGLVRTTFAGSPYGYWGDGEGSYGPVGEFWWYEGFDFNVGAIVNHYTPRLITRIAEAPITTATGSHDSGRVLVDGTWSFPLDLYAAVYDIYSDDGGQNPVFLGQEIRVSAYAHVKAQIIGRFGDVVKTSETDLLFGVGTFISYTIAWTPATKTLSIG